MHHAARKRRAPPGMPPGPGAAQPVRRGSGSPKLPGALWSVHASAAVPRRRAPNAPFGAMRSRGRPYSAAGNPCAECRRSRPGRVGQSARTGAVARVRRTPLWDIPGPVWRVARAVPPAEPRTKRPAEAISLPLVRPAGKAPPRARRHALSRANAGIWPRTSPPPPEPCTARRRQRSWTEARTTCAPLTRSALALDRLGQARRVEISL